MAFFGIRLYQIDGTGIKITCGRVGFFQIRKVNHAAVGDQLSIFDARFCIRIRPIDEPA